MRNRRRKCSAVDGYTENTEDSLRKSRRWKRQSDTGKQICYAVCNNDQTVFQPKAYGISSFSSNAMLSGNPHSGIYEADTARTLDTSDQSPAKNQGGIAVLESYTLQGSMIGRSDQNGRRAAVSTKRSLSL